MHALPLPPRARQLLVAALAVLALAVATLAATATGARAAETGGYPQSQVIRAGGDRAISGQAQSDASGPTIVLVLDNRAYVPTELDGPWIWWNDAWHPYQTVYQNGYQIDWMMDVTGTYYEHPFYEIVSVNVHRAHWGFRVQLGSFWYTANRHGRFYFLGQWYQLVRNYPGIWTFYLVQPPGSYSQPQG
jgi:hypothetical protein